MAETAYRFHWKLSGMGGVEYEVYGDGAVYRIGWCYEAGDHYRSIFNGSSADFDREVVASLHVVRKCSRPWQAVNPEVFHAFIAWLRSSREEDLGKFIRWLKERDYDEEIPESRRRFEEDLADIGKLKGGHYDLDSRTWAIDEVQPPPCDKEVVT